MGEVGREVVVTPPVVDYPPTEALLSAQDAFIAISSQASESVPESVSVLMTHT